MTLDNFKGHKVVIAKDECKALINGEEKCPQRVAAIVWTPNMLAGSETGGDWFSFCTEHAVWQLKHQPTRRIYLSGTT